MKNNGMQEQDTVIDCNLIKGSDVVL